MTSQTLSSPHDTDPRLIHNGATLVDEPTQRLYPPQSPLPRPELADTANLPAPTLPHREGVVMPEGLTDGRDIPPPPYPVPLPPPPTSDLERIMRSGEFPTLRPAAPDTLATVIARQKARNSRRRNSRRRFGLIYRGNHRVDAR